MSTHAPATSKQPQFTFSQEKLVKLLDAMIQTTWIPPDPILPIRPDYPTLPSASRSLDDYFFWKRQHERWKMGAMRMRHPWDWPPHGFIVGIALNFIQGVRSQYDLLEAISIAPEQSRKATDLFRKRIQDWAEVVCGNELSKLHLPVPPEPPPDGGEPRPIQPAEILAVGVEFDRAARTLDNHPLQEAFATAASRILEAGLKQVDELR